MFGRDAETAAYLQLRKGMKMVSMHSWEIDAECATDRIMLYPRNDLAKLMEVRDENI